MERKPFEAPQLVHIDGDLERRTRVNGVVAVASCFVRRINPGTFWPSRMKAHWQAFPTMPFASLFQSGFLAGWDAEAIWPDLRGLRHDSAGAGFIGTFLPTEPPHRRLSPDG